MELIKVENGIATRTPLPSNLVGLPNDLLIDLSWVDPALGFGNSGWWPEDDQSPTLGQYEKYGNEVLTPDSTRFVVVVVKEVLPWTPEEIAAYLKSLVPYEIPMLSACIAMINAGWMNDVMAYLDSIAGIEGQIARERFQRTVIMRRNHPLVLSISNGIGKTELEVDALFTTAGAINA